jgi:hypothetical protein
MKFNKRTCVSDEGYFDVTVTYNGQDLMTVRHSPTGVEVVEVGKKTKILFEQGRYKVAIDVARYLSKMMEPSEMSAYSSSILNSLRRRYVSVPFVGIDRYA